MVLLRIEILQDVKHRNPLELWRHFQTYRHPEADRTSELSKSIWGPYVGVSISVFAGPVLWACIQHVMICYRTHTYMNMQIDRYKDRDR